MKIVFMGTPDFAVPCLQRLISDVHEVAGVFTQPDKPKGRKGVLTPPPVKVLAEKEGIKVFQPASLKDGEAVGILKDIMPELIIVVAYGKILPPEIIRLPAFGCINIHASLLPKYRGAAPIQWAVINGEEVTGITSMQMDEGLDTGDMLLKEQVPIGENETAGELWERLSFVGADVMSKTVTELINGTLTPEKQDDSLSSYAKMLSKELSPVDWRRSAKEIHNQIRGLSPWPSATAEKDGKTIKLHASRLCEAIKGEPGEIVENDGRLIVACGNGESVEIISLQAEGKKAMTAAEFLRGNRMEKGSFLR
jgi:methionyl-tRNA formyltransferase